VRNGIDEDNNEGDLNEKNYCIPVTYSGNATPDGSYFLIAPEKGST